MRILHESARRHCPEEFGVLQDCIYSASGKPVCEDKRLAALNCGASAIVKELKN